jgi:hypothetical protein
LDGGGELIAQAFAGAGGHDAKHIAASEDILDDLALSGAEVVEAEEGLDVVPQVRHWSGIIAWGASPINACQR